MFNQNMVVYTHHVLIEHKVLSCHQKMSLYLQFNPRKTGKFCMASFTRRAHWILSVTMYVKHVVA